jgi:hypothetical protein
MSVLIDTSVSMQGEDGEVVPPQPLSRMLYLSAWDNFAPAQFKNDPPVCHFCRLSGHVRKDCPELAKRMCFSCREHGHTARFCKAKTKAKSNKETSFAVELEEYFALSGGKKLGQKSDSEELVVQEEATTVDEEDRVSLYVDDSGSGTGGVSGVSDVSGGGSGVSGDVKGETGVAGDDDLIVEITELDGKRNPLLSGQRVEYNPNSPYGSRASKYADFEVASTMKVDTVQEIMDMSKVKTKTQNKIDFLKKNIVNAPKTKASTSAIKTSKSSKSSSSALRA